MPIMQDRDEHAIRETLVACIGSRFPEAHDVAIGELGIPQSNGFSNETLIFDATWTERGAKRVQSMVARIRPTGWAIFPEYDMSLQYRCMKLVGEHSDVPVPQMFWIEEDPAVLGQPFYVMEKIDGVVPGDNPSFFNEGWLFDAKPGDQERLYRNSIAQIAKLHRIDWRQGGFGFLDRPSYGLTGMPQQLGYQRMYCRWAMDGQPNPIIEQALDWLESHIPAEDPIVLNWGDSRVGNMMYRDFAPVAVLDWEMATLGPPGVDVGWFLFMNWFLSTGTQGIDQLPGFLSNEETLALYEEQSGLRIPDLRYYEIYAALRYAIINIRIVAMMVQWGVVPAEAGAELNNPATKRLADELGLKYPV